MSLFLRAALPPFSNPFRPIFFLSSSSLTQFLWWLYVMLLEWRFHIRILQNKETYILAMGSFQQKCQWLLGVRKVTIGDKTCTQKTLRVQRLHHHQTQNHLDAQWTKKICTHIICFTTTWHECNATTELVWNLDWREWRIDGGWAMRLNGERTMEMVGELGEGEVAHPHFHFLFGM